MEGKGVSMRMVVVWAALAVVAVVVVVGGKAAEAAQCPSTSQLAGACSKYVTGSNPPVPSPTSSCCSLLQNSSPSCLCNAVPAGARSLINKQGLANVRSSCKLGGLSCPGIGK